MPHPFDLLGTGEWIVLACAACLVFHHRIDDALTAAIERARRFLG